MNYSYPELGSELEKTEVANKIKEERTNVELEKKKKEKKENIKFSIIFGLALIACIPLLIIVFLFLHLPHHIFWAQWLYVVQLYLEL